MFIFGCVVGGQGVIARYRNDTDCDHRGRVMIVLWTPNSAPTWWPVRCGVRAYSVSDLRVPVLTSLDSYLNPVGALRQAHVHELSGYSVELPRPFR